MFAIVVFLILFNVFYLIIVIIVQPYKKTQHTWSKKITIASYSVKYAVRLTTPPPPTHTHTHTHTHNQTALGPLLFSVDRKSWGEPKMGMKSQSISVKHIQLTPQGNLVWVCVCVFFAVTDYSFSYVNSSSCFCQRCCSGELRQRLTTYFTHSLTHGYHTYTVLLFSVLFSSEC